MSPANDRSFESERPVVRWRQNCLRTKQTEQKHNLKQNPHSSSRHFATAAKSPPPNQLAAASVHLSGSPSARRAAAHLLPESPSAALLLCFSLDISPPPRPDNPGSATATKQPTSWSSPSGHFAFGFYSHGNGFSVGVWLVSPTENIVVWTAKRDAPPVSSNATLELTTHGMLLLGTEQGEEKAIADVPEYRAESASMLDSGNFVLYNGSSSVIWQSFDYPTDTLLRGQNLTSGTDLVSGLSSSNHSSGRFLLRMQEDGNLVAYPVNTSFQAADAYWASNTKSEFQSFSYNLSLDYGSCKLSLDYGGQLCLYAGRSCFHMLANSSLYDNKIIYRATLDDDGIFRLYSHHVWNNAPSNVSIKWSALQDQCDVLGFCGFNSYCSSNGSKGNCFCYHGFSPIYRSGKLFNCIENASDVCGKDLKVDLNMKAMENLRWGDHPYSVVQMTKQDCRNSCEDDCNCRAVLHENQSCKKYKLPLRYGKINTSISTTAFFKVVSRSSKDGIVNVPLPSSKYIEDKGNDSLVRILGISLGSIACFCSVLAITSFLMYQQRVHSYRRLSENGNLGLTNDFTLRLFSYSELEKATNSFNEELGKGNFGAFYRGVLLGSNKSIAVKRLEKDVEEGEREFKAEITAIGRTNHKNLVRLLGFCVEGSRKLLVYEYMSNGSLANFLFEGTRRPIWKQRVRIALDVARGILYLHEECEIHIIHCNIKPQNILLDESWTAKISDFGLAKTLIPNQTKTAKSVQATTGYSAPEWQKNSLISEKADIYSFGVVLLEIICCRGSIEINVSTADEILLSSWVHICLVTGQLEKLVEDEDVEMKTLEIMSEVGLWCIQDNPELRPSMKNVILMLEGTMDVPMPPSPTLSPAM